MAWSRSNETNLGHGFTVFGYGIGIGPLGGLGRLQSPPRASFPGIRSRAFARVFLVLAPLDCMRILFTSFANLFTCCLDRKVSNKI
jgi:hypothetical protein